MYVHADQTAGADALVDHGGQAAAVPDKVDHGAQPSAHADISTVVVSASCACRVSGAGHHSCHDIRDPGRGSGQTLRQDDRGGRCRPDRPAGHGARPARAERRRQDDGRPDARHAAAAGRRHAPRSAGSTSSSDADQVRDDDRPDRSVRRRRRGPDRLREPADDRPAAGDPDARPPSSGRAICSSASS